jgi:hypothetical protein
VATDEAEADRFVNVMGRRISVVREQAREAFAARQHVPGQLRHERRGIQMPRLITYTPRLSPPFATTERGSSAASANSSTGAVAPLAAS